MGILKQTLEAVTGKIKDNCGAGQIIPFIDESRVYEGPLRKDISGLENSFIHTAVNFKAELNNGHKSNGKNFRTKVSMIIRLYDPKVYGNLDSESYGMHLSVVEQIHDVLMLDYENGKLYAPTIEEISHINEQEGAMFISEFLYSVEVPQFNITAMRSSNL